MNERDNLLIQIRNRRDALAKNKQGIALFLHDRERRNSKLPRDKSGVSAFYGVRLGHKRIAESLEDASELNQRFLSENKK